MPEGVPNFVTKEGLEALKEELRALETERANVGDNYIMGNFLDATLKQLVERINSAVEVDLAKANKDIVSFGAWVRYNGRVVRIVGVDEADVNKGLISFISPIAKSLIGKKAGDVIELKGSEKISVEEVSFDPMPLTEIVRDQPAKAAVITKRQPQEIIEAIIEEEPEQTEQPKPIVAEDRFLPNVNERGNILGRALYVELHNGNKMLHPVVHLHVLNGKGETTRLYWWHVAFGDTPEKTLKRKMTETLGLSGVKPLLKRQYIREAKNEKELVYVFTVVSEDHLPLPPEGKEYVEMFAKD